MKTIPQELRDLPQWVNWKTIERAGRKTKIPMQASGYPASSTDPTTWCQFEDLAAGLIGFVFTSSDPFIGIDLDGCRDAKTGKLEDWARDIVLKFGTYAEVSPSGTGVKLFGKSETFWKHKNKVELSGDGHGGKKPGIEVYDCGRYFAVTGQRLKGMTTIVNCDDHLEWLATLHKMHQQEQVIDGAGIRPETPVGERAAKYVAKMEPSISGSRGHDAAFKAACVLMQGFALEQSEAFGIFAREFNTRCNPPWSEREINHKLNSASKQPGQRGYLRDVAPTEWSKVYVRTGPTPEVLEDDPTTNRTTLEDATLNYLEHIIAGKEHLIETGIPDLDYAIGGGVAPGEMVIVAARPSHGKSAISLQMVHHMTGNGVPAVIVSEEMSALAIGKRAIQYITNVPEEHWRTRDVDVMSALSIHFENRAKAVVLESCGTVDRVVTEVEKAVEEIGAGVVVIDYVQLLSSKGTNRYEQVTRASQEMRRMASRLGVVVIVLAQLNRNIEERKQFIPQASDLKETGQLEQDADVIVFGVWPHRINPAANPAEYQLYVSKNRNRAINKGSLLITFEPSRQRMVESSAKMSPNYEHEFDDYNKSSW